MNPDLIFQQLTVALQRTEILMIAFWVLFLALQSLILYLTFGKVLIPLTRSVCNYLDAQAWNIDHRYTARPGHEPKSDDHYMPRR